MKNTKIVTLLAGLSSTLAIAAPLTSAHAVGNFIGKLTVDVGPGVAYVSLFSDKKRSDAGPIDITSISGKFRERAAGDTTSSVFPTTYTSLDLAPVGSGPFGSAGNTATDNKVISPATLVSNPTDPHLTTGGFIFSYSADPSDKYQLYYAGGQYQGCWSVGGDCSPKIVITSVPEPEAWALMLIGIGGIGAAHRSTRRSRAAASMRA